MKTNKMCLNAQDLPPTSNPYLDINLADDYSEVRGFGKPITARLAKRMFSDYYNDWKQVETLFDDIDKGVITNIAALQTDNRYGILKDMLAKDKHIVSGVFGKEIIHQLLAQKNCEGIRYIIGKSPKGRTTVILFSVKESEGFETDEDDVTQIKKSEPVSGLNEKFDIQKVGDESLHNVQDPLIAEVHGSGKTMQQLESILNKESANYLNDIKNVVFGIY